jgi:hypothetical protein
MKTRPTIKFACILPSSLPHRPLGTMQPSMYNFAGPPSGAAPFSPTFGGFPSRQRSNSDGSLLRSSSPPLLVPRIPSQGAEQVNYVPRHSSLYAPIPVSLGSNHPQPHQQQSPTSHGIWPASLDGRRHNIGFTPYVQVAYPPYSTVSSAFSQPPTMALPQDTAGPPIPRWTLAGSLDPSTGIFYRTPEHPRLRTVQACDKCRLRKAKVYQTSLFNMFPADSDYILAI